MRSIFSTGFYGRVAALFMLSVLSGFASANINEEQKLSPTANPAAQAGSSSAIFGDTAVVGAPSDTGDAIGCAPGGGAAYVFTRSGTVWTKVATLCASNGVSGDLFGKSVSINAGNIAVGAPGASSSTGAAYVYSGSGSSWTENATILTDGALAGGSLGAAVSIQGFTVAAGAPTTTVGGKINTGVTIVYTSNDSGVTWTHTTFRPSGGQARNGALFGSAVSLSGSTILVGAPGFRTGTKLNSGAMFVFVNNGSVWTQQARIRPANVANAFTGADVSLFQDIAAFGAPGTNGSRGVVYVYTRSGTTWTQTDSVADPGNTAGDLFGSSVAIQGSPSTILSAGAPGAVPGGAAYELGSSGGAYSLLNQLVATDNASGDTFGASTRFDSGRIIVGAPNSATTGAAYIFKVKSESLTEFTGIVNDLDFATPSLTGVPYDVFIRVYDNTGGNATPTGSVHIDDSNGGSCDAALSASGAPDGHAVGTCSLTSTFFGNLSVNASYGGDLNFSASSDSVGHDVVGNHLVFNPTPPPDVTQGEAVNGVIVQLLDGANNVITSNSTTQVTLTVDDSCGNTGIVIGTLTLASGQADFTGLGPKFYTVATGLSINATPDDSSSPANGNINVAANADIVFADGFEECRL